MNKNNPIENGEMDSIKGFIQFKEKVLDKKGELEIISRQLTEISITEDYLDSMDFFFGKYFPSKYGKGASKFLFELLADTNNIINGLLENNLIDLVDKAELDLIAFRHNELIKKLSSNFEHPYSLTSSACVTNGEGEYLLSLKRIDGESINLYLTLPKSYRLINNLLESTLNSFEDWDNDIQEEIINDFLLLSDQVKKLANKNK